MQGFVLDGLFFVLSLNPRPNHLFLYLSRNLVVQPVIQLQEFTTNIR